MCGVSVPVFLVLLRVILPNILLRGDPGTIPVNGTT